MNNWQPKRRISVFSYPIVISEKGGYLVLECPDFGIFQPVDLPDGRFVTLKTAVRIGHAWLQIMRKVHLEAKRKGIAGKPLPMPSITKEVFNKDVSLDETYSPEEIAPALGVSVNTIRRALDQNIVPHIKTPGGHRRLSGPHVRALKEALESKCKSKDTSIDQ